MIDAKSLRIGNWIHCKGSSHYGIVTGEILALLEKDEKMREKFEGIELSGRLLEAAGFNLDEDLGDQKYYQPKDLNKGYGVCLDHTDIFFYSFNHRGIEPLIYDSPNFHYLHHFQNLIFCLTGSELPLPESAKLINQAIPQ